MRVHGVVEAVTDVASLKQRVSDVSGRLVVALFRADGYAPCQRIMPHVEMLSVHFPFVVFYSMDIERCPELAAAWGVRALPTFLLFRHAVLFAEYVGADEKRLRELVMEHSVPQLNPVGEKSAFQLHHQQVQLLGQQQERRQRILRKTHTASRKLPIPRAVPPSPPSRHTFRLAGDVPPASGWQPRSMVDVRIIDPTISVRIPHTLASMLGEPPPRCLLQLPCALALAGAQARLLPAKLSLVLCGAYRPWSVLRDAYAALASEEAELALSPPALPPTLPSACALSRGTAVEVTLCRLPADDLESPSAATSVQSAAQSAAALAALPLLEMPTKVGERWHGGTGESSHLVDNESGSAAALRNLATLDSAMRDAGFSRVDSGAWWLYEVSELSSQHPVRDAAPSMLLPGGYPDGVAAAATNTSSSSGSSSSSSSSSSNSGGSGGSGGAGGATGGSADGPSCGLTGANPKSEEAEGTPWRKVSIGEVSASAWRMLVNSVDGKRPPQEDNQLEMQSGGQSDNQLEMQRCAARQ